MMTRRLLRGLALLAFAGLTATLAPACGSSGSSGNGGNGGSADSGAGCTGSAPACFGSDATACCGQDPGPNAKCVNGAWMCGSAPAPGCDVKGCRWSEAGSPDAAPDASCTGSAPFCRGNDVSQCCAQDPGLNATCVNGAWMCGSALAPGCNGKVCLHGVDAGSCAGSAPLCFGNNSSQCCGQDPAGNATCVNGAWLCGSAPAPGCNGTNCLLAVDAGAPD